MNKTAKGTQDSATSSDSGGGSSTASSACKDPQASLKIEDAPTFELNKVEFLDLLGQGKTNNLLKIACRGLRKGQAV